MIKSLIYLDSDNPNNSVDLIEVVRQMYPDVEVENYMLSFEEGESGLNIADVLIRVNKEDGIEGDARIVASIMEELHKEYNFECIIIPASNFGRMLAPRLAMALHTGLTADVTAIACKDNQVEMIRPAFSGKIMAAIVKKGLGPNMLSVRENVFHLDESYTRKTREIQYTPKNNLKSNIVLIDKSPKIESYDIRNSKVLISGGNGVAKNFNKLEGLANELNGHVSASRMIIDKGIAPRTIQVGQSGRTVNPKLYMALGIDGAIQHVEGLKHVEHIISVNINKNAPLCSLSDLVVEGDANEFIDLLMKRIQKEYSHES